jgi:hypothetical protein
MDHRQRRRNNKISDEIRELIINSMNNGTTANNKICSTYRRTQNTYYQKNCWASTTKTI